MQEVGRAVIESSDVDFFAHLFFLVHGCSSRHILGICCKRYIHLPFNGSVPVSVAIILMLCFLLQSAGARE